MVPGADRHPIHELSKRHVEAMAELDPDNATRVGRLGHEHRVTDHSPGGLAARTEQLRSVLADVEGLPPAQGADRTAVDFHRERITAELDLIEAGETVRALRVLGSPVQAMRQVFDLLATTSVEDWEIIATRLHNIPAGVTGLVELLEHGMAHDLMSSRRQAEGCAAQARTWSGQEGEPSFFASLLAGADVAGVDVDPALERRLRSGAEAASAAYAGLARFLLDTYLPRAPSADGVGRERYLLHARRHLGSVLDVDEAYAWGWDEVRRLDTEMLAVAARIRPGLGVGDVIDLLDGDPAGAIEGAQDLRAWLQELMDATIDELSDTHFDIPGPLRTVQAMIAPPGGTAAMYYTGPSEDFSRPGRTWYPTQGRTRFPLWGEVSICYHEGVPGHHLQVATVTHLGPRLSALQRSTFVPGHGEGWALYAERLMDELGYLDDPGHRLGYLRAQLMRARRVVADIGMHLELRLPADIVSGEPRWHPELAHRFMTTDAGFPPQFMASEVDRYLGLPAQAISYKLGERVWLDGREAVRRRLGNRFELRAFHRSALALGHLGLDQLREELTTMQPR